MNILRHTLYINQRSKFTPISWIVRPYAISRFPSKGTGTSRKRERPAAVSKPTPSPLPDHDKWSEPAPSSNDSTLWQAAQRPPMSDPERGLAHILENSDRLVIERQIEMLNIFVGFEQANKYAIHNEADEIVGYIVEEARGFLSLLTRQLFATHRPFKAIIMDSHGTPLLWIRRPFAWINSRMYVQRLKDYNSYSEEGEPVLDTFAEVQQIWHPWRRRYDLFLREKQVRVLSLASDTQPEPPVTIFHQMSRVDSGFLAWEFPVHDEKGQKIALIDRAFRGFGREIFTDTGRYCVDFKPKSDPEVEPSLPVTSSNTLSLDRRALLLALAVNIDFDYFSRHSSSGPGGFFHFGGWD